MTIFLPNASHWRRWLALLPDERLLLGRSLLLLVKAHYTLPRTKFEQVAAMPNASAAERPGPSHDQRIRARQVARMVAYAAAVCPVHVACLHRSLVLWQLLGREGIACDLRIGVRTAARDFEAHAWVECGGEPLHQAADLSEQFSPFAEVVVPARAPSATPSSGGWSRMWSGQGG